MSTAKAATCSFNVKNAPRDDLQKEALAFLLKMKNDPSERSRFLSLGTGSGKTYVSIAFISKMKKRSMIIVDTIELAEQWKREFLKHTDLNDSDIKILSGSESVEQEKKSPSAKVYIAIHRTLSNILSVDTNAVNILMNKLQIGIRVFDESHVEFNNICRINSLSNVEYTLYLTATPNRSNFNEDSLYGKVFKKIPYYNGKNENYITVVFTKMNSAPSLDIKAGIRTKYGFSMPKWANYINSDDGYQPFLEIVVKLLTDLKLVDRKKKTIIMLPTIDLIKRLKKDLEELFPGTDIGMFIGEIKKDQREKEKDKLLILTNDKICGKGMDIKDLEVLINFIQTGSSVLTDQIAGRLRHIEGKTSMLIDVTDYGFDECIKNFKIRRRFYRKKAKKIIEIK